MHVGFFTTFLSAAFATVIVISPANATIFFDWKCTAQNSDGNCATEPGLNLTFGFKDFVVTPNNTFTGADIGLDSLSFTSTIGDGFTIGLADWVIDRGNFKVTFNADATEVKGLEDAGADTLLFVGNFSPAPGLIRFREGNGELDLNGNIRDYAINRRQDNGPSFAFDFTEVPGKFVRRADFKPVPEPETFSLLGVALGGFFAFRRRRNAAVSR